VWARRESNSDGSPHWNLNPARLPIPPRAREGGGFASGGGATARSERPWLRVSLAAAERTRLLARAPAEAALDLPISADEIALRRFARPLHFGHAVSPLPPQFRHFAIAVSRIHIPMARLYNQPGAFARVAARPNSKQRRVGVLARSGGCECLVFRRPVHLVSLNWLSIDPNGQEMRMTECP
jgi:hypothetical protein